MRQGCCKGLVSFHKLLFIILFNPWHFSSLVLSPPRFPLRRVSNSLVHIIIEKHLLTRCCWGFLFLSQTQLARPETCCLRCWSSILLSGYQWMRPYSTPTSTCGMIQLRWRRWVGLWQSCVLITLPSSVLSCCLWSAGAVTDSHFVFSLSYKK